MFCLFMARTVDLILNQKQQIFASVCATGRCASLPRGSTFV